MGFFPSANKPERLTGKTNTSIELLHRAGCQACPLDKAKCRNPKMEPHGDGQLIYVLGSNPTAAADRINRPMTGPGKEMLFKHTPASMRGKMRFSNIVRTAAGQAINPTMIECCRPSIIKDIEETQPFAIFGLGEEVLRWALNQSGIHKWTGRYIPVKIGSHLCWFFPLLDPVEMLKRRRNDYYESEEEIAWAFAVKRAFKLLKTLPEPIVDTKEQAKANIEYIDGSGGESDLKRLEAGLAAMAREKLVGFDYETDRVRGYNRDSMLLTASIASDKRALAIALDHPGAFWPKAMLTKVHRLLERWLYESACEKVSHHLHFELEWSAIFYGRDVVRATPWHDTVTQAWLIDERNKMGKPDCHALEFLTLLYFGLNIKTLNSLDQGALAKAPLDQVLEYNAIDAKYHLALHHVQTEELKRENLIKQYHAMNARIPTMVLTQVKGVPIRQKTVNKFKRYYEKNIKLIEADISDSKAAQAFKRIIGRSFEPSNPKDVLLLITKVLGEDATNKKDKQSSGFEVLERIDDPIAELILEHRSAAKSLSTYVLPVLSSSPLVYDDGLLHPQISTTRTLTSRTSSEDPNAQNWPKRKRGGTMVRSQIAADDPDARIVSFDFAGIQARNIAMECLDKNFMNSFWTGHDIHADWTTWLAKKAGESWNKVHKVGSVKLFLKEKASFKDARGVIKNGFVFPTFFGAQSRSISVSLGVEQSIIDRMQEELFGEFPGVLEWQNRIKSHYAEHGWITGHTGIKRRAPCSPNQLINAPIQADEAWIVCDAMTRLSKMSSEKDDRLQANMEIHDDLTFIWHKKDIDTLAPIVIKEMISVPFKWAHCVPIEVEMSVGTDWSNQKEVGKFSSATFTDLGYRREDFL